MNTLRARMLKPLADLRVAIAALAFLMVLTVVCTLDQVNIGTFNAVDKYFRDFFLWAPLPLVGWRVPVFPAGGAVGALLLAGLTASLSERIQWTWRKAGIIVSHLGLILLIAGEFVTGRFAVESQLAIEEGQTLNYSEEPRADELVVADLSEPGYEQVYAIRERALREGRVLAHRDWPFTLRVRRFFPNAAVGPRPEGGNLPPSLADRGLGPALVVQPMSPTSSDDARNQRAAFLELSADGKPAGVWLAASALGREQEFAAGGRRWSLALRPARRYLPFSLTLHDFAHDRYPGTEIPKNFSSRVQLVDPEIGEDRQVLISMNNPLRYGGRTFYQASFGKNDTLSVLQVVENPGWLLPYLACTLVGLGMLWQFLLHLKGFTPAPARAAASARAGAPAAVVAAALLWTVAPRATAAAHSDGLGAFARLPVLHGGRVKPIDTIARNSLLLIRGKQTLVDGGERLGAVEWLLELWAQPEKADLRKVFVIHDPDVLGLLNRQQGREKYFSYSELAPHAGEIAAQARRAEQIEPKLRSRFQSAVVNLDQRLLLYQRLKFSLGGAAGQELAAELLQYRIAVAEGKEALAKHGAGGGVAESAALQKLGGFFRRYQFLAEASYFKPIPPAPGLGADEWRNFGESLLESMKSGEIAPAVSGYAEILAARRAGDGAALERAVAAQAALAAARAPEAVRIARHETAFNAAQPFYRGMIVYLLAFLLGCASFLSRAHGERLRRAAFWTLAAALAVHTAGLVSRMWLQGRPPVTNLYSSAVFVGWGAALLAAVVERMHKSGLASLAASAVGFATLIIAHHLATSGDTLEMMQAVLDSNFWLATHVVTITIGYSATYLAGMLGILWIARRALGRLDAAASRQLAQMAYGVVCFALLLSFIGTILGGIWADQSWGRFWGWDPKENGALLLVLWNALILHARWGGFARERGIMAMAVFGNVITSLSWFGVNMLGIGLHSYGFMDKAFLWLSGFCLSQVALIALAYAPEILRWAHGFAPAGETPERA